ncbi:hypothetical protein Cni_G10732 [Canna indica]|uniref:CBM20 domain-containing protein n=1 Tax=Canna indica TaxID=4628 RepID=A0AAQ3K4R1_9LILI|nr:hypothetical protein Cni_G10732 [Canna indica]
MDALASQCVSGFINNTTKFAISTAGSSSLSHIRIPKKSNCGHALRLGQPPMRMPSCPPLNSVALETDVLTSDSDSKMSTGKTFSNHLFDLLIDSCEVDWHLSLTKCYLSDHHNTVHIRFAMHKECSFGQDILMVGEDPMFGAWDPSMAIPMEWTPGHLWTAELAVPVGRKMEFKFIVRGLSGEIKWQPGPDRSIETWATNNTIVVCEDWENAEHQQVTEEDPSALVLETGMTDDESETSEMHSVSPEEMTAVKV